MQQAGTLIQRLWRAIRKEGLGGAVRKLHRRLLEYFYDIQNKTDTSGRTTLEHLTIKQGSLKDSVHYNPAQVSHLRKLFTIMGPHLPASPSLVDFGCGKGRVLLVASEFEFLQIKGIELTTELSEIARRNCEIYKSRHKTNANFEVIEHDATTYKILPTENVFFMFNPFHAPIVQKVMENLEKSLAHHPRKILIAYLHPLCADVIDKHNHFQRILQMRLWELDFILYGN